MSHESNTLLLEWAAEIMEEFTGTWIERRVRELVNDNDLEELKRFIKHHAGDLARQHFYNRDLEEYGDIY